MSIIYFSIKFLLKKIPLGVSRILSQDKLNNLFNQICFANERNA